jgi:signal transduction histidine kinase
MPVTSKAFIRTTIVLLIVGFLTVLGIVSAAIFYSDQTEKGLDELVFALELRREALGTLVNMQRAETGQRGFLLTQDEAYLQPFNAAVAGLQGQIALMKADAESLPAYAEAVGLLETKTAEKLAELRETIGLVREGRIEDALAIVRSDRGKIVMDEINALANGLVEATDRLVQLRLTETRSSAALLYWILLGGGFLILVVVGGTAWIAWRYTTQLERAQRELTSLNVTLEERVRQRAGALARANEEIQRFAYIVSHDLRAPLVNIMGFTSELETGLAAVRAHVGELPDDLPATKEVKDAIESDMPEAIAFIRASTGRMDSLINAILKMSREGRRQLTAADVDMRALLEEAADSVRHQVAEAGGEIHVETPLPAIRSDRLALEQIFGNLIDNAVKYLDDARPPEIVIRGRPIRTGVEFEVQDNGRGIAPDDHERIFELFRRSGAQDKPGEGIGLSHVRALVRRLGGDITLQSELGKGTTFRVSLPENMPIHLESA